MTMVKWVAPLRRRRAMATPARTRLRSDLP